MGDLIHFVSHQLLPTNERLCVQVQAGPAHGLQLELNPRTGQAYLRGEIEIATQKLLAEKLRPGMVFYDLGANIGFFSLLAARLVGGDGRVISFEPDAEVATRLRCNIALNEFSNITVVEAGVWSKSESVRFLASDESSPERGTGRLLGCENQAEGTPTRCVALDDFVKSAALPDAMKCDVEGAELEALRGAENLLRTRRPWIICELHPQGNEQMVREFLSGVGYSVQSVDINHILAEPNTEN